MKTEDLLAKLHVRRQSFGIAVDFLRKVATVRRPVIVETGCIRSLDDYGCGYSTYLWQLLTQEIDLEAWSIDNARANIEFAGRICPNVRFICGDSVARLGAWDRPAIDLLYLDSFDLDQNDPHPSSLHHLMELTAGTRALVPASSLVMVDDNYGDIGKGKYVSAFMQATGRELIYDGIQKIWIW